MLGSLKEKKREMDWGGESQPFKSSGSYLSRMKRAYNNDGAETMAACFCLPLCDQNGPLVIRTWIPNLGRTGFLLSTLTSENFMPTTLGIGVQWPAMGLERRWWLLKTYKLKLTRHKCNLVLPRWLSSKQSACQCRRPSFDPWVGKIPWRRKW